MTPYHESDGVTLYHGDNVQTMREAIPDASIDLVVTSPPYDNLRTYGGHTWDFEGLAAELWRVIKPGGVVVWVVADATVDGSETGTSFRQALHFKELGFRLLDTMVWNKPPSGACGSSLCYAQSAEWMFILTKGKPKAVNRLKDRLNVTAGRTRAHPMHGRSNKYAPGALKNARETTTELFGYRTNVWETAIGLGAGDQTDHPAPFPESLARDHILSWSNEGDTVLDPFSGSGTTIKMARLMGRKGIGIEIHQEYCDIAVERLRQRLLF